MINKDKQNQFLLHIFYLIFFRLSTFSIAANSIAKIEARALEPIHQITALSLQNNQLTSITTGDGTGIFYILNFIFPIN